MSTYTAQIADAIVARQREWRAAAEQHPIIRDLIEVFPGAMVTSVDVMTDSPPTPEPVLPHPTVFDLSIEPDSHIEPPLPEPIENPATTEGVNLDDFRAYMPMHNYIFAPTREVWPAASVNARLGAVPIIDSDGNPILDERDKPKRLKATSWLDQHRAVEQMTWTPGEPMLIRDRLVSDGGWIERPGCTTFNTYRPPTIQLGDARKADRWFDHIRHIYPNDADHIINWLAQRVQRPDEKINHALVLGGRQGIGKDTILEPVKHAVGPWNFKEITPAHLLGRFNDFTKSVILRINEARDLGDVDRFTFYDHLKIYTAAPPDVIRVDEKNLREYAVWNVCGVVITTNHRIDGLYLPTDDRRHYVAWSERTKDEFPATYWSDLYFWYAQEGHRHVAAYLTSRDLARFDAKAPPPQTEAFWSIVNANRTPEDADMADALERLGYPNAVTLTAIAEASLSSAFGAWLKDRKNAKAVPHRLEVAGYVAVRNPDAKDGLWRIHNHRQAVYVKHELSPRDRLQVARSARGDQ